MSSSNYNPYLYSYGSPVFLRGDVTFGANGTAAALTGAKNLDITSITQLQADSACYLIRLGPRFVRWHGASYVSYGQKAAVGGGNWHVPADGVGGGAAMLVTVSAAAGNVVTINGVAFTAVAYNGSLSVLGTWRVGNSDDTVSATNLAAIINASVLPAITGAGIVARVVTDVTIGATVVSVTSTDSKSTIAVTGAPITLVGGPAMNPGLVVVFNVGVTPTAPATGDTIRFWIELENASAAGMFS